MGVDTLLSRLQQEVGADPLNPHKLRALLSLVERLDMKCDKVYVVIFIDHENNSSTALPATSAYGSIKMAKKAVLKLMIDVLISVEWLAGKNIEQRYFRLLKLLAESKNIEKSINAFNEFWCSQKAAIAVYLVELKINP